MRYAWEIVIRLRPTLVVAALALAILALPTQVLELYLIDIETVRTEWEKIGKLELPNEQPRNYITFLLSTHSNWSAMLTGVGTMFVLWVASAHLICLAPDLETWGRSRRWLAAGLVVLITLAPVLGVLGGLANILKSMPQIVPPRDDETENTVAAMLRRDVWIYIAASTALAATAIIPLAFLTFARLSRVRRLGQRIFSSVGIVIGLCLILGGSAAITIWPTGLPWAIGTQALVYLFLAALTFVLTWFSQLYRRTGWPVTVMVIAGCLLFSAMGWNDNHKIDHKIVQAENNSLAKNFETWLLTRQDRKWFADNGKRYPVYVVAAEGGGMFAGYHAASWLGSMQDKCPRFAQHTFAISSVSGGSLGSAVYSGLLKSSATNRPFGPCAGDTQHFSRSAEEYFSKDLLAPLVAGTLFPDFLQRLLPFPFKALDRAGALEKAFAANWNDIAKLPQHRGIFERPLHQMWDPNGPTPALFLNTTSVSAGSRVMISPIQFQQTPTALHLNSTLCIPWTDTKSIVEIPLTTAVSLSARFPWLTPAGWFDLSETKCRDKTERDRVYLVDGGYFENSGLETALDIARHMHEAIKPSLHAQRSKIDLDRLKKEYPHGIDIKIIMLFAIDAAASRYMMSDGERSGQRPGEILPPLNAMIAGRSARTRAVHLTTVEEGNIPSSTFGGGTSAAYPIDLNSAIRYGQDAVHQIWLDGTKFFLPLGWRLSTRSIRAIADSAQTSLALKLVEAELMGLDTSVLKAQKASR